MIVLGIDPGLASTGWAVLENGKNLRLLDSGCIRTKKKDPFSQRLTSLSQQIKKLALKTKPKAVAIEEIFFSKNTKTAIKVAQAIGAIKVACCELDIPVFEYTPLNIKIAITGYGRADKKQVKYMVKKILNLKRKITTNHAVDAVAVSLTHFQTNSNLKI